MDRTVTIFDDWRFYSTLTFFLLNVGQVYSQEYDISLDRPERSGNTYKASFRGVREGTFKGEGGDKALPPLWKKGSKQRIVVELDASVKILEVDTNGRVLRQLLSVTRWRFDGAEEGEVEEGFELKGKVISVSGRNDSLELKVDGRRLEGLENEMLQLILASHMGDVGTDRRLGSKKKRRVGDSWPMAENARFLQELLPSDIFSEKTIVRQPPIKGVVTFSTMKDSHGIEYRQINAVRKCKDALNGFLSDNRKIVGNEVERRFTAQFPKNMSSRVLYSKRSDRWSLVTELTEGLFEGVKLRQTLLETSEKWLR